MSIGGYKAFERFKQATNIKVMYRLYYSKPILSRNRTAHDIRRRSRRSTGATRWPAVAVKVIGICWACLATLSTKGPCCGHMNDPHDGIELPNEAGEDDDKVD